MLNSMKLLGRMQTRRGKFVIFINGQASCHLIGIVFIAYGVLLYSGSIT